jgi:hypothetical protein
MNARLNVPATANYFNPAHQWVSHTAMAVESPV